MIEQNSFDKQALQTQGTDTKQKKERQDLVILLSMAKKLLITLRTLEQAEQALPVSYTFKERRGRTHRMIICAPDELLNISQMHIVGFISQRRAKVDELVLAELFQADTNMLAELHHIPGLLSYSSLELRPGNWYNLVVFRETIPKEHFQKMDTHRYAAHQLSPTYYEWIRLYTGYMPTGLAGLEMVLSNTRYFSFAERVQKPI